MKTIAIIGSGISGMAAAHLLSSKYNVTLYEKNPMLGGHTRTKTISYRDKEIAVDTGFIVFNHVNYLELTGMFRHFGVDTEKSDMSFGFTMDHGRFEWGAQSIDAVFGQRRNLLNPLFYKMILDVLRFFKEAPKCLSKNEMTLGQLLNSLKLGKGFCNRFIVPMGAAIWSCPPDKMLDFPAQTFVRFFINHGLLSLNGQHQWYTVTGGSQQYIKKLTASLQGNIQLNSGIERVWSEAEKVAIQTKDSEKKLYDHVVLASHADESLAMLVDATPEEKKILGAFQYQANKAYLHSDITQMPKRKRCWASWSYSATDDKQVSLTYWMNKLQNIDSAYPLFVTLNPKQAIAPDKIFDEHEFAHPIFTREAIAAQKEIPSIQGKRNIWYCGAYQRYGFHEDGLLSAIAVAEKLGATVPWH